jgi:hypothetical protein
MDRPCVASGIYDLEIIGLALLYPALEWSVGAPGHHGYPRASDLILGKALRGRLGHQITGATARPFLHLLGKQYKAVDTALRGQVDDPATSRRIFPPRCACATACLLEERG